MYIPKLPDNNHLTIIRQPNQTTTNFKTVTANIMLEA